METADQSTDAASAHAAETLREVQRRLVGIYASVAESLRDDPDVVPWVAEELKDLLRYIRESGAAPTVRERRTA